MDCTKGENDPKRETGIFGVYRIDPDGKVTTVVDKLDRPNGITFSPDYKKIYVAQSLPGKAHVYVWDVDEKGDLQNQKVFYDATLLSKKDRGLPDGLKTDHLGNLWCTGPGGVLIISPEGKLLGRILTGQATANCGWGDDGSTLYMTADYYLLRVRTKVKGAGMK